MPKHRNIVIRHNPYVGSHPEVEPDVSAEEQFSGFFGVYGIWPRLDADTYMPYTTLAEGTDKCIGWARKTANHGYGLVSFRDTIRVVDGKTETIRERQWEFVRDWELDTDRLSTYIASGIDAFGHAKQLIRDEGPTLVAIEVPADPDYQRGEYGFSTEVGTIEYKAPKGRAARCYVFMGWYADVGPRDFPAWTGRSRAAEAPPVRLFDPEMYIGPFYGPQAAEEAVECMRGWAGELRQDWRCDRIDPTYLHGSAEISLDDDRLEFAEAVGRIRARAPQESDE